MALLKFCNSVYSDIVTSFLELTINDQLRCTAEKTKIILENNYLSANVVVCCI